MEPVVETSTTKGRPRLLAWVCRLVLALMLLVLIGYVGVIVHELTRSVQPVYVETLKPGSAADQPTRSALSAEVATLDADKDLFPISEKIPEQDRMYMGIINDMHRRISKGISKYWVDDSDLKNHDPYVYFFGLIRSLYGMDSMLDNHPDYFTKEETARIRQTVQETGKRIEAAMVDCYRKQRRWDDLARYYQSKRDWYSELYYLRQMGPAGRDIIMTRVAERCIDSVLRHVRAPDGARMKAMKG